MVMVLLLVLLLPYVRGVCARMWGKGSLGESMGACEHPRQRVVVESAGRIQAQREKASLHSLAVHNALNHVTSVVPAHRRWTTPNTPAATLPATAGHHTPLP